MRELRTVEDVREWLGGQLRHPVSNALWHHLRGDVADLLDGEPTAREDLMDEARAFDKLLRHEVTTGAGGAKRTGPKGRPELKVPGRESLRAQVLSGCLSRIASRFPEVCAFRTDNLQGGILTSEQAGNLLNSEIPRFFAPEFFRKRSIPLIGHSSRICDSRSPAHAATSRRVHKIAFEIRWEAGRLRLPCPERRRQQIRNPLCPRLEILRYTFGATAGLPAREHPERARVVPGSVFDMLRTVANVLVKPFGWTEEDATWFVLTDTAPPSHPVEAQYVVLLSHHSRLRFHITVDSSTPSRTLLSVYKQLQKKYVGRQSRPFSERNLRLVEEVEGMMSGLDERPSWGSMMLLWNKKYSAWAYEDRRRFRRDYLRTRRGILRPSYRWAALLNPSGSTEKALTTAPPRASMSNKGKRLTP